MSFWLLKEEPGTYSFADLEREGETAWTGVSNALALKHLRQCKVGDRAFFYHTGKEKAIVGVMTIARVDVPQDIGDKSVAVVVRPERRLPRPVTLAEIKREKRLVGWDLVRLPRLSVLPVTPIQWRIVEELAAIAP
jgi:predicted RNA-binding protein with PUA-like domain